MTIRTGENIRDGKVFRIVRGLINPGLEIFTEFLLSDLCVRLSELSV